MLKTRWLAFKSFPCFFFFFSNLIFYLLIRVDLHSVWIYMTRAGNFLTDTVPLMTHLIACMSPSILYASTTKSKAVAFVIKMSKGLCSEIIWLFAGSTCLDCRTWELRILNSFCWKEKGTNSLCDSEILLRILWFLKHFHSVFLEPS